MNNRQLEVEVSSLGSGGDGVVNTSDGRIYVPYSAPGDHLRVRLPEKHSDTMRAEIVERLQDSPSRKEPVCSHFLVCGGCAVQHITVSSYLIWKRSLVEDALSHRGIDAAVVAEVLTGGLRSRRRTRLHARLTARGALLGYLSAGSHRIVPVDECPVLEPSIVELFAPLQMLLTAFLSRGQEAEISITMCDTGLDVAIAMGKSLQLVQRQKLVAFAEGNNLARLSWQPLQRGKAGELETIIRRMSPTISYAGIKVEIPSGAFVQATAEGESVLRDAILMSIDGSRRVLDLFAGCGAFALPVAASGLHVMAVDSVADQILALESAARRVALGEFVRTEVRDLNRRPFMEAELGRFNAVILDPPRAGALVQIKLLATAPVPTVVYVSCNPASFARDARILIDGGFELKSVKPVDQFVFSAHIELVAVFKRIML